MTEKATQTPASICDLEHEIIQAQGLLEGLDDILNETTIQHNAIPPLIAAIGRHLDQAVEQAYKRDRS